MTNVRKKPDFGWLLCASLFFSTVAYCTTDDAVCPGAAAWKKAHPEQTVAAAALRDKARALTDEDLRKELQQRVAIDQQARQKYLAAPHDREVIRHVETIDADNLSWLKRWIAKKGVPTAQQVGEGGLQLLWLLVQHTDRDPKFQAALIPIFAQRYKDGELPGDDLAKLIDRVLLAQGKSQRFGTQFNWTSDEFKLRNPRDTANMDAHRAELGLMPLADYACEMDSMLRNNNARRAANPEN